MSGGHSIITATVAGDAQGWRLDRALAAAVPTLSRERLKALIAAGAVTDPGGALVRDPATKAAPGGAYRLAVPDPKPAHNEAQDIALDIVFEDEHLCVVNKPAGLVVHPAPGNWSGTLLNALLGRDAAAARLPRAGIVHRLDKDTSGLMVVARTRQVMDRLVAMIAAREVSRQYVALAHRVWEGAATRHVEAPIGRDPRNRLRMAVVDLQHHAGKPASTVFELLENAAEGCWVRATLQTGRTHQIRVHMAHIGHPLVGDPVYGGRMRLPRGGSPEMIRAVQDFPRQALHARRLGLVHPVTGEDMSWESPLPADMLALLAVLAEDMKG